MDTIGERIKAVRKNRKINQIDFAQSLGISQTHVSKMEKNIENPSKTLLMFISHKYRVSLEWLEFGIGEVNLELNLEKDGCINQIHTIAYQLERVIKHLGEHDSGTVMFCLKAFYNSILGPVLSYCVNNDANLDEFFNYKNESHLLYSTYLDTLEELTSSIRHLTMDLSNNLIDDDINNLTLDNFNKNSANNKNLITDKVDDMITKNFECKEKYFGNRRKL